MLTPYFTQRARKAACYIRYPIDQGNSSIEFMGAP